MRRSFGKYVMDAAIYLHLGTIVVDCVGGQKNMSTLFANKPLCPMVPLKILYCVSWKMPTAGLYQRDFDGKGKREKEKWLEGNRTAKNWANCERNLPQNCKECYVIWHVCSLWLTMYVYLCALHTRTKSMFDSQ